MRETLLNYGEKAKTSQLPMSMFFKNTRGKMYAVKPLVADADVKLGLKACFAFTKSSNIVDMISMEAIQRDDFFQEHLLLKTVNLRRKLKRAKNSFCLLCSATNPNFKVSITEAIMFVLKVKVAPSIILGHAAGLLKNATTKYPIYYVDCKALTIPQGFGSFNPDNMFLGHTPNA